MQMRPLIKTIKLFQFSLGIFISQGVEKEMVIKFKINKQVELLDVIIF